jgi:alkylhydroperoxidase family enzyme
MTGYRDLSTHHGRPALDPERIAARLERGGYSTQESLLVALAALATTASPLTDADLEWIASAAARLGDADLLLETAGIVFAFNTINRVADGRRVRLEFRFLREFKPIRGWLERRLASLTRLVFDLSYEHQPRHSSAEMLDRLSDLFERLGVPALPDVFNWLSRAPVVLEGVFEILKSNLTSAGVRLDLLKEAAAIAVAARAIPDSDLNRAVEQWLPPGSLPASLPDSKIPRSGAAPSGGDAELTLVSACRRYAWQVANAAYTITDEQIREIRALGLSDAELLDLTLATALFSALAIIEPISAAVAPIPTAGRADVAVQLALKEELAV